MHFNLLLNMHPKEIRISDFAYDLPDERIARYPLPERDASRLLVYRGGAIREGRYRDLADFLPERALLVFNDTRVIPARLTFRTATGAAVEIFCLEPDDALHPEPAAAMQRTGEVAWRCLVGKAAKWREPALALALDGLTLRAERLGREAGTFTVRFRWAPAELTFAEVLGRIGDIPIPPYLRRGSEAVDRDRYQTVYAAHEGSVAAPTAGLHFTDAVFARLEAEGIRRAHVTLHVGAGTFKPVKSATLADHDMHAEWIQLTTAFVDDLRRTLAGESPARAVVAVGTTSLRTLESLYWMGVKATQRPEASLAELELGQWDPYELPQGTDPATALAALHHWLTARGADDLTCQTRVILAPPYRLRVAHALVTNFHQPQSTLLLLIACLVGEAWRDIYRHALDHGYRFLSYGDGSLLFREGA